MKTVVSGQKINKLTAEFAADLVRMKHRAGTLGLFATMQALDKATEMVGWEMAGDVLGPRRIAKLRAFERDVEAARRGDGPVGQAGTTASDWKGQ